ncbi:flagellar filament capping protein FliD [Sphingomonas sp. LaA6.9]|uniref:flagellar filament capping protein FliD n=1 Tax=Sphingomonas sp. LaA6.9 TaxID=2919914 RepID=UPI001F502633|nr:flagellar filament capping protein FliD [Sphingomonas sp. LaA6.9]MCJ8156363.1 flagellar filament capping protein FliD [Sphingomonas sp. LaA6.9]
MVTSITSSMGLGAGFDTAQLIEDLAAAQRGPQEARIKARETANSAQISTIGSLAGAIDSFASSLKALIAGGSLFTQPTTSDASIVGVSAKAGYSLGGLSAQIEVVQIATAQSLASAHVADPTAPVGQGTLILTTGKGSFNVKIDSTNDSLNGLAAAINNAKAGVSASVVKDSLGSRLVIRGGNGEASAFTLEPQAGADPALSAYSWNGTSGGMTCAQQARDAIVKLDGVEIRRDTNTFSDVLDGVKIDLKKAAPGQVVTIGAERPVDDLRQAVLDFAAAYNELETMLDDAGAGGLDGTVAGPLRGSSAVRDMRRQLAAITATALRSGDGPKTLAEIGVVTLRDGSLKVDTSVLDAALLAHPEAIESFFNPSTATGSTDKGLGGVLQAVRDTLRDKDGALASIQDRLRAESKDIEGDRETMEMRADAYRERLVRNFTAMDTRVASYKATQSYLEQQIKMWTNGND